MNQLTLSECSKRKLDETYLVVYVVKNEILKSCGVQDILYMCSDGIAGFKGSLESVIHAIS